ncbi:hypothetical protein MIR68_006576 [Amoeboaphelidium protococcarum]|nr:hypothetical protein MIR68_006576 [Amoeboaphelidium protococcarum]
MRVFSIVLISVLIVQSLALPFFGGLGGLLGGIGSGVKNIVSSAKSHNGAGLAQSIGSIADTGTGTGLGSSIGSIVASFLGGG